MFSFAKIATVATLALGTFVSAVPVQDRTLEARADSVTSILDTLTTTVGPIAAQFSTRVFCTVVMCDSDSVSCLGTLDASNATAAVISPIVSDITSAVSGAVNQIKALPSGTTATDDALTSLSNVLSSILTPAGDVAAISGVSSDAIAAFSPLGNALGDLVNEVLQLVAGILVVLRQTLDTLLNGLVGVIDRLSLSPLLSALGL
ncbi:hypothetical protein FA95DRAFT_999169 [Auriscalpium vulgare]|uniref:Uncharacterized protein n=1 Tax=Auriscalpium vulgare TaxID=40419 RepID=A0ACB8RY50_9AGAM|nr:hypothetical protein FA95DRAFT_999169 [Auriscalpium vulgare]